MKEHQKSRRSLSRARSSTETDSHIYLYADKTDDMIMDKIASAYQNLLKNLSSPHGVHFFWLIFSLIISASPDLSAQLYSEEENTVWSARKPEYQSELKPAGKIYNLQFNSLSDYLTVPLIYTYWIAISEPDGDKCPFHPSCSSFLMNSIDAEGLFTGTILFFDRFTRDANIVNRREHYPLFSHGKYFDAHNVYLLDGSGNANPWFAEYIYLMEKKK